MQPIIYKVLQALNEIEVKGERNHDLLLYAIQQLKKVQAELLQKAEQPLPESKGGDDL